MVLIVGQVTYDQYDSSDNHQGQIQKRGSTYPTNSDYSNWSSISNQADLVPRSIGFCDEYQ